jgi:hypothetical protein
MPDDFENDGQADGGALRKQLEAALKDKKALETQLAELSKQVRSSSVEKLFADAKADARGIKFYSGEPTKEALAEWLKGDGDVFATAPAAPPAEQGGAPAGGEAPQFQLPPGVTPEMLAAAQATAGMQPTPGSNPVDLSSLADKVGASAMSSDADVSDLDKLFTGIRSQAAALYQQRGY